MSENRLTDLLADETLFGLDPSEKQELLELAEFSAEPEIESFDLAAAIVDLSMLNPETMPETLEQKLIRQGRAAIATNAGGMPRIERDYGYAENGFDSDESSNAASVAADRTTEVAKEYENHTTTTSNNRIREIVAWGCAAAIGFVALMSWTNNRDSLKQLEQQLAEARGESAKLAKKSDSLNKQVINLKGLNLNLSDESKSLVAENQRMNKQLNPNGQELFNELVKLDKALRWKWSPVKNNNTAKGEVIWDGVSQRGVMKLVDLKQNDPLTSQYQLWIIEEDGRENPVDGGVFNVNDSGEVFIPINAKLFASKPAAFAITIEEPNGVVVSEKGERLSLIAKAPATED